MEKIKKFEEYEVNEHLFSGAEDKDASYEDMEKALTSIVASLKNGVISVKDGVKKIKDLVNVKQPTYPLSGAQQ